MDNWHYVKTKYNPADLALRGVLPENLDQCNLWWTGSDFFQQSIDHLICNTNIQNVAVPVLKQSSHTFFSKNIEHYDIFLIYSDFN